MKVLNKITASDFEQYPSERPVAYEDQIDNHSSNHEINGSDEINLAGLAGEPAELTTHKAESATLAEKAHVKQGIVSATILSTGWTGSEAPYTQVVTATGVKAGDVSTVDIDLSNATDYAEEQAIIGEWPKIYRIVATDDDELTVYATEETSEDIEISIKVVR